MERLESEIWEADILLRQEHRHRYMWAARYAKGAVCDLACGRGYGAEIIQGNSLVSSYTGIDASAETIDEAKKRFSGAGRSYAFGSAINIPLCDNSVDTVVSLETLEHLTEPARALEEFKRILRPRGVLVGSVPSNYFDDRAEEVYGINPYHVTRFSYNNLVSLLSQHFRTFRVYYTALEVVTRIGTLSNGHPTYKESATAIRDKVDDEVSGSFHFVASDYEWPDIDSLHKNYIYFCAGLIDIDAEKVIPLRNLLHASDRLVELKDAQLIHAEELLRLKDENLKKAEELLHLKDKHLKQAENILNEKVARALVLEAQMSCLEHRIARFLRISFERLKRCFSFKVGNRPID